MISAKKKNKHEIVFKEKDTKLVRAERKTSRKRYKKKNRHIFWKKDLSNHRIHKNLEKYFD